VLVLAGLVWVGLVGVSLVGLAEWQDEQQQILWESSIRSRLPYSSFPFLSWRSNPLFRP